MPAGEELLHVPAQAGRKLGKPRFDLGAQRVALFPGEEELRVEQVLGPARENLHENEIRPGDDRHSPAPHDEWATTREDVLEEPSLPDDDVDRRRSRARDADDARERFFGIASSDLDDGAGRREVRPDVTREERGLDGEQVEVQRGAYDAVNGEGHGADQSRRRAPPVQHPEDLVEKRVVHERLESEPRRPRPLSRPARARASSRVVPGGSAARKTSRHVSPIRRASAIRSSGVRPRECRAASAERSRRKAELAIGDSLPGTGAPATGLATIRAVTPAPTSSDFDVVVLGGGPGGERAAIQAAKAHKRVALVEQASVVGGARVNWGTIPSKTLRESALFFLGMTRHRLHGFQTEVTTTSRSPTSCTASGSSCSASST